MDSSTGFLKALRSAVGLRMPLEPPVPSIGAHEESPIFSLGKGISGFVPWSGLEEMLPPSVQSLDTPTFQDDRSKS